MSKPRGDYRFATDPLLAFVPTGATRIQAHNGGMKTHRLTAVIEREDDMFVSLCPELDIASQGNTIEEAHANLKEALTLFFQSADPIEVAGRLHSEVFVTSVEVAVG